MHITPTTTLSLLIDGDDLIWCAVRHSLLGTKTTLGQRIDGFILLSSASQSLALQAAPHASRIVLTVPMDWCVLRPVPISIANWSTAKAEIATSIESLVPIPQSEALIGLIGRASREGEPESSYLVVIDRNRLAPWTNAIERALHRRDLIVQSPHMSMLGLGLQEEERVELVEGASGAAPTIHRLLHGEVDELACAMTPLDSAQCARYYLMSGRSSESAATPLDVRIISSMHMAEGAALAPRVAPRHFVPMVGRAARPVPRWLAPGLASLGALACVWLASVTMNARYEWAGEAIRYKQATLDERLELVLADRARVDQVVQLVEQEFAALTAGWRWVLPELEAAHRVLPDDAFFYRILIDGEALTIRGEATRASEVLERLEASALFSNARSLDAPVLVEERGAEQFHIKADRTSQGEEESS